MDNNKISEDLYTDIAFDDDESKKAKDEPALFNLEEEIEKLLSDKGNKVTEIYSEDKTVGEIEVNVKGKVIYINMDFVESVKVETAQSSAIKALDKIGEENLKFYEVQFILTCKDNENFPVFGSKNANSLKVVW